jgi:hypothetical protein
MNASDDGLDFKHVPDFLREAENVSDVGLLLLAGLVSLLSMAAAPLVAVASFALPYRLLKLVFR